MIPHKLKTAIQYFKKKHPEWQTPEGALNECVEASDLFVTFVKERKLKIGAKLYTFNVLEKKNRLSRFYLLKSNTSEYHCIVKTRYGFIDWTARQYNSKYPYPLILPRNAT